MELENLRWKCERSLTIYEAPLPSPLSPGPFPEAPRCGKHISRCSRTWTLPSVKGILRSGTTGAQGWVLWSGGPGSAAALLLPWGRARLRSRHTWSPFWAVRPCVSVCLSVCPWGCSGVDHSPCSSWPSSSVGSKAVPLNPASPVTPSLAFKKTYVFFNWRIIALQNFVVFCQTSA